MKVTTWYCPMNAFLPWFQIKLIPLLILLFPWNPVHREKLMYIKVKYSSIISPHRKAIIYTWVLSITFLLSSISFSESLSFSNSFWHLVSNIARKLTNSPCLVLEATFICNQVINHTDCKNHSKLFWFFFSIVMQETFLILTIAKYLHMLAYATLKPGSLIAYKEKNYRHWKKFQNIFIPKIDKSLIRLYLSPASFRQG